MSGEYPQTRTLAANLLKAEGGVPVGCRVLHGRLIPALSAADGAECPENILYAAYSATARAFFATADGVLYRVSEDGASAELSQFTAENPFLTEERGSDGTSVYVFGDVAYLEYSDGNFKTVLQKPGLRGGCLKNGRIFAVDAEDGSKLRWSGAGDVKDWNEGIDGAGWAYVGGEYGRILKTAVLRDKLVAVHEYGLTVISASGVPENFRLEKGAQSRSVLGRTAFTTGSSLVFYADGGLYKFDGSEIYELKCAKAFGLSEPVCAASAGGEYFISGRIEACGRSAVLAVNPEEDEAYVIDMQAEALAAGRGQLYAFCGGRMRAAVTGGRYTFVCGGLDFGTRGVKRLLRLEISAAEPITADIGNGRSVRRFSGVSGVIRPRISGTDFKITLYGGGEIYSAKAYAEAFSGN